VTTYYGVCFDSGIWDGDLTGLLVVREDAGYVVVASHISSNASFSRRDIEWHFNRLDDSEATFEWLGQMTVPVLETRFGWE
jgi:hypothetical protein